MPSAWLCPVFLRQVAKSANGSETRRLNRGLDCRTILLKEQGWAIWIDLHQRQDSDEERGRHFLCPHLLKKKLRCLSRFHVQSVVPCGWCERSRTVHWKKDSLSDDCDTSSASPAAHASLMTMRYTAYRPSGPIGPPPTPSDSGFRKGKWKVL